MTLGDSLIILYSIVLGGLALYALYFFYLIMLYLWHRKKTPPSLPNYHEAELPHVTVQIPLRNERYVVTRLLNASADLEWPRDKLTLQVLDDSNDDTTTLAQRIVTEKQQLGLDMILIQRQHPQGYKAGALAAGLQRTSSEYIAIFDADFLPPPDFLRHTVPHLMQNQQLGFVQTRWGHLNAGYSAITRAQALLLDAHFTIDHVARQHAQLFINFNGTAGVWRRQAIDAAGGWQSDTIAEDLDLSFRAQLAGWPGLYLPDIVAPAEVPPLITSFKQQQYRWAKGATQVLRKLWRPLLRSPQLTVWQKIMTIFHLSAYFTQPLFLLILLLTLPLILFAPPIPPLITALDATTMILPLYYLLGQMAHYRDWPRRILYYPVLMVLGLGITWNTTCALWDGLRHWGGEFTRTPKFKLSGHQGQWRNSHYLQKSQGLYRYAYIKNGEICVGLYALGVTLLAYHQHRMELLPFSITYVVGMAGMIWGTLQTHKGILKK